MSKEPPTQHVGGHPSPASSPPPAACSHVPAGEPDASSESASGREGTGAGGSGGQSSDCWAQAGGHEDKTTWHQGGTRRTSLGGKGASSLARKGGV